jgi:hypothetical protein
MVGAGGEGGATIRRWRIWNFGFRGVVVEIVLVRREIGRMEFGGIPGGRRGRSDFVTRKKRDFVSRRKLILLVDFRRKRVAFLRKRAVG